MSINLHKSGGEYRVSISDLLAFLRSERERQIGPVRKYLTSLINRIEKSVEKIEDK
jgi:hypothetical protein